MQLIESKTLGSAQASIEFTNIPQTFTDLLLVLSTRTTRASTVEGNRLRFNGVTTGYSNRLLYGNGSGVGSNTDTNATAGVSSAANQTANTFGNSVIYIPNYTSANNKSFSADGVNENNATEAWQFMSAALWSNSAAITNIEVLSESGSNYVQYSMASLYGITKGSDGTTTVS